MTRAQHAAMANFAQQFGCTKMELFKELKANGTLDRNARLEDVGDYVNGTTFEAMWKFLEDNI